MIRVLTRYMRLYKAFFFQCLKEDMIYRSNFLTLVIMDIGFVCVSLILFKVIYGHVNTIAGWTFNQSVILIGTVGIVREMAYLTFRRGFLELGNHIRTGTFDMFMVRPIASGIHLGLRHLSISESFGEGMMGIALVVYGLIHVDTWSWIVFPLYILFLLNSLMIYYGFSLIINSIVFWVVKSQELNTVVFFHGDIPLSRRYLQGYRQGDIHIYYTDRDHRNGAGIGADRTFRIQFRNTVAFHRNFVPVCGIVCVEDEH